MISSMSKLRLDISVNLEKLTSQPETAWEVTQVPRWPSSWNYMSTGRRTISQSSHLYSTTFYLMGSTLALACPTITCIQHIPVFTLPCAFPWQFCRKPWWKLHAWNSGMHSRTFWTIKCHHFFYFTGSTLSLQNCLRMSYGDCWVNIHYMRCFTMLTDSRTKLNRLFFPLI